MREHDTIEFAGVGGVSGGPGFPDYLRTLFDVAPADTTTMKDAVSVLQNEYSIEAREVAFDDPTDEAEWTATGRHQALVNPADGHLWHIPTHEYTPVQPMEKYGPLLAALRTRDMHDEVAGQFRLFRGGGEVHADILFDALRTGDDDEIVLGVQTGYDYYGGKALYAEIIAYDTSAGRMMRGLSETRSRRHTGAAGDEVAAWWTDVLNQAEDATETLARVMVEAQDYDVDFSEIPMTPVQYLTHAFDGTAYLAENDGDSEELTGGAVAYLPDVPNPHSATFTGYELYAAMASALTHDFHGKDDSSAIRKYVRRSNRQLFSPARMEDDVLEMRAEELEGQEDLSGEAAVEQIRDRQDTIGEAVAKHRERTDTLKRLVNEAESAEGSA